MADILEYLPPLLAASQVTIQVTALAAVLGAVFATIAGVARLSQSRLTRGIARTYVEVFRGTSVLVQMFWFFFALPQFGIALTPMAAGVAALGLNIGAYGAEVVRGAVQAIPRGQWEAAIALNLSPFQRMRRVILPQAFIIMLPPVGNLLIELLKASALVSLITLTDITFQAQLLRARTLESAKIFALVLIIYFVLAYAITLVVRATERHVSKGVRISSTQGGAT